MKDDNISQLSAKQICKMLDGVLVGPETIAVKGIATLADATTFDISFLGNDKYRKQVLTSKSAIVLVPHNFVTPPPENRAWIKCDNPSEAFIEITQKFNSYQYIPACGIHDSASIHHSVAIGNNVHIGAAVILEENVKIGCESVIEAGSYIGPNSQIGEHCRIHPNVTIRERSIIGQRVIIHSGTVIGSDGFGYINSSDGHKKIPQSGVVQIDDDVEIGANVTIDRARFDKTWIKRGAKIDNLVQIGHNVIIGENVIIVAQAGVSGSVDIGNNVIIAGQSGVVGHLKIGEGAILMAKSVWSRDAEPGVAYCGYPAVPRQTFWKQAAAVQKLPELLKRVKSLEKEIEEMKQAAD